MAALPSIKLITREALKEAPGWIDQLLSPLNSFMSSVYENLNRGLTLRQNVRCTIKELRFQTPSDYESANGFTEIVFASGLRVKADWVTIMHIAKAGSTAHIVGGPVAVWTERDGNIRIPFISGLEDSTDYTVRLFVI